MESKLEKIMFWFKPNGTAFCNGRLSACDEMENRIYCLKSRYDVGIKFPIDCKYVEPNYDFPILTQCGYKRNG